MMESNVSENTFIQEVLRLPALTGFGIMTILVLAVSFFLRWFWRNILIRFARMTSTTLDRRVFEATGEAAQLTFIAVSMRISWKMFGPSIVEKYSGYSWLNTGYIKDAADHGFFLFLIFAVAYLLWKTVFAIIDWFEKDFAPTTETTMDDKIVYAVRNVMKVLFTTFTVMIIADHFKMPLSKIWAVAGIGSLAMAFAAKDTFSHLISGIIILFDRPFHVGDRVELNDGTFGDVIDIGLRSTKILSFDSTLHIIPNAEISNQRITNHSYPDTKLKVGMNVSVAYGTDIDFVKRLLNGILEAHPLVLNEPVWGIWFTEFGDSSLNLFMRFWINDYRDKFAVIDQINSEIKRAFEENAIEIPFPQRDIHFIRPKRQ